MKVKGLYRFTLTVLCIFMLVPIPLTGSAVHSNSDTTLAEGTLAITLDAGDYKLLAENEQTRIEMEQDFGSFSASGEPQLPGRTFFIALPPGAEVSRVSFAALEALDLPGRYELTPTKPSVTDGKDVDQAWVQWELDRKRAYATDSAYPANVGEYRGQYQWRGYTIAQVSFQPFQYKSLSGALRYHPHLIVTIDYRMPETESPAWIEAQQLRGDHVLDDLIATQVVNFTQAQAWYETSNDHAPTLNSLYDYVIIVQNDTIAETVAPFKTWKESLGHTVKIVTLKWIDDNYSGVDMAEKVWNFLHDKYPASSWGIRYLLLVGDLQVIPTRRVYYADEGWGLRSDHFYAKLSGGDTSEDVWNRDNDARWGELHDDEMIVTPDVLVGRIPLNEASDITNAINAMIAYEQDSGGWKHTALLAGGYNDITSATSKTDNAVLMELIRKDLLDPNGWSYTRLYEKSGLGTSTYTPPPDDDVSNANVVTAWNAADYGLAILDNHGNADGLSGVYWQHDTTNIGTADDKEVVWSDLFQKSDVANLTNTHTPIVELIGCSSLIMVGPPWPDPDQTMATPGSYTDNTGSELLANGMAAGLVGFSAPEPYRSGWSKLDDGDMSTVAYYFAEDLVQNQYSLGWSLFDTKIRYTAKFYNNNYEPFHWAFNLFGDPSMVLEGYDTSALSTNTTIYTGAVYAYGTDNDDNGDMYVAVSTQASNVDGIIKVYKSTNHGMTWNLWTTIGHSNGILAVDVIVGNWPEGEILYPCLHVFFSDTSGDVYDEWIKLDDPATSNRITVANEGSVANITTLSAARDPIAMPSLFHLYLTWEVTVGDSHQVKAVYGENNGIWWSDPDLAVFEGYGQPHIDAGPDNYVYLVAIADAFPNDVSVKRSIDNGSSWGAWKNLTDVDSGDYHAAPVVAASTDPGAPTVWVAYNYYKPVVIGGGDVRFAYSTDGGGSWTTDQPLSVERGIDELNPDMVGYRSDLSQWMNIAYDNGQSAGTQVMWRWSSGSTPNNWWSPRLVNDNATHIAMGPQVIYSPGATATGSGVVYPGTGSPINDLYFAAPWLTGVTSSVQPMLDGSPGDMPVQKMSITPNSPLNPAAPALTPFWTTTGELPEAFRIASLARNQTGLIFAAATTSAFNEANTGTIFRSADNGDTWEPTQPIPDAWWLDSVLVSNANTLLVGGTAYSTSSPGESEHGIIYRSTNNGDAWSPAIVLLYETVVHTLIQRLNGQLVAGTGPNGVILASDDDGQHWEPLGLPPSTTQIYALWETSSGELYAGGARSDGHGVIYHFVNDAWQDVGTLSGIAAVYALTDQDGTLYSGVVTEAGAGQVIRSPDNGATWETLPGLPTSQAVRALLNLDGTIYAGLDAGDGPYTTFVYQLPQGATTWQPAGMLFMADAVYSFLRMPDGKVYAASGDTYGVVFCTTSLESEKLYLPLILRH